MLEALLDASLAADAFASGREALEKLSADVALVVVAGRASDVSGLALCRRMRELPGGSAVTLVVVSALADEMDRVLAFENGADDFVSEPFFARELAVRVRALLRRARRSGPVEARNEVEAGTLRLDLRAGLVEVEGRRVRLTRRELEVLRQLVLNQGRVVGRAELLGALDGEPHASPRLIDTYVKSIRSKLGSARAFVATVRGIGYRFDTAPD